MSSQPDLQLASRSRSHRHWRLLASALVAVAATVRAEAQTYEVLAHQKVSDTEGEFDGVLDDVDFFGRGVAALGDLDGDGIQDLAVSAPYDDDGGADQGAVWVLFLDAGGGVKAHQKISATQGGFTGGLDAEDWFGESVAALGDLDGDGLVDLAVGARNDDDGGGGRGAVWVLFLNPDGSVKAHQKISTTAGGFTGDVGNLDIFGSALANLGDLDGDGVQDLAVGAPWDDDGGTAHGAVWVLFLNPDGTVKGHQKISDTEGGFTGELDDGDDLGNALSPLGDLDGDGVADLAAGAYFDDDGGSARGAVWILFLNPDGTVKAHQKISDTQGGFAGILHNNDFFGSSLAALGDFDCDGVGDLVVGARLDDDGGSGRGAAWVLFLAADGTVRAHQKISDFEGGFRGELDDADSFGFGLAVPGDLDGDEVADLVVGAAGDDDGGSGRGAAWILYAGRGAPGTPYCFGDGGGAPCPCGNESPPGSATGCANSTGTGGRLGALGSNDAAADDLVLRAEELLPGQPGLLFVAHEALNGGNGFVFGDGLRCAGVNLVRLGTETPDATRAACWGPGLRQLGGWDAGDTRRFQVWYRDPQSSPCASGFNLTNGLELVFAP